MTEIKASSREDEAGEDTDQQAEQFLDEWELHELLINDEKLLESKNDETGPCKHSE